VEYINQQRVKRAQKLLRQQKKSVTDVTYDLGYSSISHFIKLFKDHTGLTPKQYQLENVS